MRGRMQILTRTVTVITKPQHISNWDVSNVVVYHPYSSPNHNSPFCTGCYGKVVSHPYSSPNHNIRHTLISLCLLYLILIHHQTTTLNPLFEARFMLYLILIHHQTTTYILQFTCIERYIYRYNIDKMARRLPYHHKNTKKTPAE